MGEVVHGVDHPILSSAVMLDEFDAIDQWISHQHVFVRHVNFRTENMRGLWELAGLHTLKQFKVLLWRTIAKWTIYTWFPRCTFLIGHVCCRLVVNVSLA